MSIQVMKKQMKETESKNHQWMIGKMTILLVKEILKEFEVINNNLLCF